MTLHWAASHVGRGQESSSDAASFYYDIFSFFLTDLHAIKLYNTWTSNPAAFKHWVCFSHVWTLRPQPWEERLALLAILYERFRSASKKTRQVDMVAFRVIHWLLSAVIVLKCQAGPLTVKHEYTNSTSCRSDFEAFVGSFLCSFE